MKDRMEDLVIIGTGPAGYTAAVYAARANLKPLILAGELPGGQLTQTTDVENYPGFEEGVLGYDLMAKMQAQAERFGTRLKYDIVESVTFKDGGPQTLHLAGGKELQARAVIISTGATPRRLGIPSEDALETKGVTYCAVCDGAFFPDVPHVVVGGGDSAMEEAVFLTKFASKVTIVHRRDEFRASKIMADRAINHPKIEVAWDSEVAEVLGEDVGKVTGVRLRNLKTAETTEVPCGAVFVAIGHTPNTAFLGGQIATDDQGYVLLEGTGSRTNVEGVFAAGDCGDHTYRQAITAAGMGCKAALDAERWLELQED